MKNIKLSILIVMLLSAYSFANETIVIVNQANSQNEITSTELKKIYLGLQSKWSDGNKVVAVDQSVESKIGEDFIKNVLKLAVDYYQGTWMEKMLSGAATPPESVSSDEEVIELVTSNKGGIGYVSKAPQNAKVKVIKVK